MGFQVTAVEFDKLSTVKSNWISCCFGLLNYVNLSTNVTSSNLSE
jgi:hypothetical protein